MVIEIIDDGVGLLPDFNSTDKRAAVWGTRLMRTIAHGLNAKLEFAKGDPGQIVRLELPRLRT